MKTHSLLLIHNFRLDYFGIVYMDLNDAKRYQYGGKTHLPAVRLLNAATHPNLRRSWLYTIFRKRQNQKGSYNACGHTLPFQQSRVPQERHPSFSRPSSSPPTREPAWCILVYCLCRDSKPRHWQASSYWDR